MHLDWAGAQRSKTTQSLTAYLNAVVYCLVSIGFGSLTTHAEKVAACSGTESTDKAS